MPSPTGPAARTGAGAGTPARHGTAIADQTAAANSGNSTKRFIPNFPTLSSRTVNHPPTNTKAKAITTAAPAQVESAPAISRGRLLAALTLVAIANTGAATSAHIIAVKGWAAAALEGLGFSWSVWLATILALRLAMKARPRAADAADLAVAGIVVAAVAAPGSRDLPALAATLAGGWFALRPGAGVGLRAAGLIVVAIAAQMFWVGAGMLVFGRQLEAGDARVAAWLAGTAAEGNAVRFLHGAGGYYVAQGCSAALNVATALLLWLAIARSARPALRWSDLAIVLGLTFTVTAFNSVRLAVMAQDVQTMHAWHGSSGAAAYNALVTVTSLAWTLFDVRKELFGRVLGRDGRVADADLGRPAGVRVPRPGAAAD
jgi:hypothetical protein